MDSIESNRSKGEHLFRRQRMITGKRLVRPAASLGMLFALALSGYNWSDGSPDPEITDTTTGICTII